MIKYFLIPFFALPLFSFCTDEADDFDSKLDRIVRDFKANIMDVEQCKNLQSDVDNLADDIEDALDDDPDNIELKNLKKEAEALENFIGGVAVGTNYVPTIEQFNLANKRVGALITSVTPKGACVDVVKVTIGEFVAYMFQNNTDINYTVSYSWKSTTTTGSGSGEMGLWNHSMRQIYTNQENSKQKSISVSGITCKVIAAVPGY